MTEQEMREMKAPWPKSRQELNEFLDMLETQNDDYGKAVYCMSLGAVATYYYMSHVVGASGFQASCADLDFIARTRSMERFTIVNVDNAVYPQYDLVGRLQEYIDENKDYLKEKAQKLLEDKSEYAHPDVVAHWEKLANG